MACRPRPTQRAWHSASPAPRPEQVRKVKLAVQKFRTDIYRIALRMRVSWAA